MLPAKTFYIWLTLVLAVVELTNAYPIQAGNIQICDYKEMMSDRSYALCQLLHKLSVADAERGFVSDEHRNNSPGAKSLMERLELVSPPPADDFMQTTDRFRLPSKDVRKLYMQLKRTDTSHFNRFG